MTKSATPESEETLENSLDNINRAKKQATFISKLRQMLESPATDKLIKWSPNGDAFCVFNIVDFSKIYLPQYFKHNNWHSFVRQLNMYGFRKVNESYNATNNPEIPTWEFKHENFKRDRPDLQIHIRRRLNRFSPSVVNPASPSTIIFNQYGPHQGEEPSPQWSLSSTLVDPYSSHSPMGIEPMRQFTNNERTEELQARLEKLECDLAMMKRSYNLLWSQNIGSRALRDKCVEFISRITNFLVLAFETEGFHLNQKLKIELEELKIELAKISREELLHDGHSKSPLFAIKSRWVPPESTIKDNVLLPDPSAIQPKSPASHAQNQSFVTRLPPLNNGGCRYQPYPISPPSSSSKSYCVLPPIKSSFYSSETREAAPNPGVCYRKIP